MSNYYKNLTEKWAPVLNEESAGEIKDSYRKAVTAVVLENQEAALQEQRQQITEAVPGNSTASIDRWDPVLISLVRRAMPNMMAYDVCGVQPMTGPTGLIFAMKSRFGAGSTGSTEALFNEADTTHSGTRTVTAIDSDNPTGFTGLDSATSPHFEGPTIDDDRVTASDNTGIGMETDSAEALGSANNTAFNSMGFTIEKATVTAKSRALKAEYSLELAQDLKAIHGLDAETELANILSTEIMAEINREVVRTINSQAKTGCLQANVRIKGVFDLSADADGRWSVEKFKGMIMQIEREANQIAIETRRGKGNFITCSSDVASALSAAGMLDYTPALSTNLNVDDTGNTFAGVLNGRFKVYIDPYSANQNSKQFYVVGYKGTSPYDAGMFYCPYVPLQMVRAVGQDTFQPKIGFKTRYGLQANPFAEAGSGDNAVINGAGSANSNRYYRKVQVTNLA